jgi:glycosyltransferase involved in cell wall biosynthesis
MPLSAVVITLNAGTQIEGCLASVSFAQEILVVDSGSTDNTLAIARRYGARIVEKEWLGFGLQKQFAVDSASHDWILSLDADEVVSEPLKLSILEALAAPKAMAYEMARCNCFLGRWLRHGEGYPDWSIRLFRRSNARWSKDTVHEKVVADAKPSRLQGDLLHASAETIERYLEKQNRYTSLQAAQLLASGKKAGVTRLLLSPALRFIKFYFLRLGFLDGLPGLVHVSLGCMNSFNKYAKLVEIGNSARQKA